MHEFLEAFTEPLAIVGIAGQVLFSLRFLVQWVVSERKQESTVPLIFWYFSLGGGVMLLTYALLRREPIIAIGQACGLIVYFRNLALIHRKRRAELAGRLPS